MNTSVLQTAHKPAPNPNAFLSFEEARQYLGNVKASTLRQWTSERRITSYKPGKSVMYRHSDLDTFMVQCVRRSNEQLNQDLEHKRQELNRTVPLLENQKKGARS